MLCGLGRKSWRSGTRKLKPCAVPYWVLQRASLLSLGEIKTGGVSGSWRPAAGLVQYAPELLKVLGDPAWNMGRPGR